MRRPWTTKKGIESWWGPGGFKVKVRSLDLRPGGEMHYTMIATGAQQIEFMKKAGMPTTQGVQIRYVEIEPKQRLVYLNLADFIPGVAPYEVETRVELFPIAKGVRMLLTLEPMHNDEWTQRAVMGWEGKLGKLAAALAA
jgi:uncharacterized protein YndB with AHSA1/START domain